MNQAELLHNVDRIAIIKLSSLGDVLHASACAEAIKRTRPEALLAWVVDERFAGLLEGNPFIDELVIVPWKSGLLPRFKALVEAGKHLKELKIELVIDLQGLFKSALIARYSKAPYKACAADAREGAKAVAKYYMTAPKGVGGADKQLAYVASLGADIADLDMKLEPTAEALESVKRLLVDEGLKNFQSFLLVLAPVIFCSGAKVILHQQGRFHGHGHVQVVPRLPFFHRHNQVEVMTVGFLILAENRRLGFVLAGLCHADHHVRTHSVRNDDRQRFQRIPVKPRVEFGQARFQPFHLPSALILKVDVDVACNHFWWRWRWGDRGNFFSRVYSW